MLLSGKVHLQDKSYADSKHIWMYLSFDFVRSNMSVIIDVLLSSVHVYYGL